MATYTLQGIEAADTFNVSETSLQETTTTPFISLGVNVGSISLVPIAINLDNYFDINLYNIKSPTTLPVDVQPNRRPNYGLLYPRGIYNR